MTESYYKELEIAILDFGEALIDPPPSAADLFRILDDLFFECLRHVGRSPPVSIQNALSPVKKALVDAKIFKHSDFDVKVAVAGCITEIARISAPHRPYDDEQMKEIFKLIVSPFEYLNSCEPYLLLIYTLETVAKARLCAVMLDLQCDTLLIEMFQHFLKNISYYHRESVFSSMKKIMTLVLEESVDIPRDMLSLILHYVRKDAKVPAGPRRLAEEVLSNCASNSKLKTYLTEAVNSSGLPFDKYSKIVASICEVTNSAEEKPDVEDHSMEKEPDSSKTSDIKEGTEPGALMDSKVVLRLPPDDSSINAATSSENEKKTSVQALPSKTPADETANGSSRAEDYVGDIVSLLPSMSPPAKKSKAISKTKKPQSPMLTTPMLPPAKKRKTTATIKKKTTPMPQLTSPIPSLPYDLLLSCIARLSRLYYPTLSFVSKSFRSLLASPELYKVRSLLGRTESCLYVCVQSSPDSRWFTLCRKPDETLTNETSKRAKSNGYALATLPDSDYPENGKPFFKGLVVVGSNIYSINRFGSMPCMSSSTRMWILDCRSHTWRETPETPCSLVEMAYLFASVLDQKIYIAAKNRIEVFHTTTETWDPKPIPWSKTHGSFYIETASIDGKFHVMGNKGVVAYNSNEGRWDTVGEWSKMRSYMVGDSYCEIENVLYSAHDGELTWYDTEANKWKELKGLVGLPKFRRGKKGIRLTDYGGKMAVLWEEPFPLYSFWKSIWCAEITLEKRKSCEIWGKVEWFDKVLSSIPSLNLVKVLAATV